MCRSNHLPRYRVYSHPSAASAGEHEALKECLRQVRSVRIAARQMATQVATRVAGRGVTGGPPYDAAWHGGCYGRAASTMLNRIGFALVLAAPLLTACTDVAVE